MIESALMERLKDAMPAAVAGGKVFVDAIPQDENADRVLITLVPGGGREYYTKGVTDLTNSIIRIQIYASQYEDGRTIYTTIRVKIDGKGGGALTWGTAPNPLIPIRSSFLSVPRAPWVAPGHGDEVGQPTIECVADVIYRET